MLDLYAFYQAQGTVVKTMFWVLFVSILFGCWS